LHQENDCTIPAVGVVPTTIEEGNGTVGRPRVFDQVDLVRVRVRPGKKLQLLYKLVEVHSGVVSEHIS